MSAPDPSQFPQNPYEPPPQQPYAAWTNSGVDEENQVVAAGFGVRFAARVIDLIMSLVMGFAVGIASGIALALLAASGAIEPDWAQKLRVLSIGSLVLSFMGSTLYHAISESIGGASIGKLIMGLRVRAEDSSPAPFGGTLIRSLAILIDGFFFGAVGYGAMNGSVKQQRLGDQWGHTMVVQASSLPAAAPRGNVALGLLLGMGVWMACLALGTAIKLM